MPLRCQKMPWHHVGRDLIRLSKRVMSKLDKGLLGQEKPGKFYALAVLKGPGSTPATKAFAKASPTLMPSTPADKMPPA